MVPSDSENSGIGRDPIGGGSPYSAEVASTSAAEEVGPGDSRVDFREISGENAKVR
jgi:hypothetical protein